MIPRGLFGAGDRPHHLEDVPFYYGKDINALLNQRNQELGGFERWVRNNDFDLAEFSDEAKAQLLDYKIPLLTRINTTRAHVDRLATDEQSRMISAVLDDKSLPLEGIRKNIRRIIPSEIRGAVLSAFDDQVAKEAVETAATDGIRAALDVARSMATPIGFQAIHGALDYVLAESIFAPAKPFRTYTETIEVINGTATPYARSLLMSIADTAFVDNLYLPEAQI